MCLDVMWTVASDASHLGLEVTLAVAQVLLIGDMIVFWVTRLERQKVVIQLLSRSIAQRWLPILHGVAMTLRAEIHLTLA